MVVSADGNTLFARVRKQILRSSDGGMTWVWRGFGVLLPLHGTNEDQAEVRLYMSPSYAVDSLVFVHNIDGLYKSSDSGDTWLLLPNSPVSVQAHDNLAFSPTFASDGKFWVAGRRGASVDVYASSDGGGTFTRLRCPVTPVTMLATASGLLVCGVDGKLYASTDDASWTLVDELAFSPKRMTETRAGSSLVKVLVGGVTDVVHLSLCSDTLLARCGSHVSYASVIQGNYFGLTVLLGHVLTQACCAPGIANPHSLTYSVGGHVGPTGESLYILPPASLYMLRSVDGGLTWHRQNNTFGVRALVVSASEVDIESGKSFQCFGSAPGTSRVYMAGDLRCCSVVLCCVVCLDLVREQGTAACT